MWTPISFDKLYDFIIDTETSLLGEQNNFWELIKITPEKWAENSYGREGNGFWVVAICGRQIIWYNDIEEGFNISSYTAYGQIDEYWCNQDDLKIAIQNLFYLLKYGGYLTGQASPPVN